MSVTIILAAIVGVGIWLFYPRGEAEPDQLADTGGGLEWEPLDYLRGDEQMPGLEPEPEAEDPDEDDEFVVTYGVAEEEAPPRGDDDRFVTEAPPPREPAEPEDAGAAAPEEPAPAPVTDAPAREPAAAPGDRAPEQEPEPVAATARPASPTARSEPAPAEEELADRAYWVQVISSPHRDTVEVAQRTLREHQLGSRILTKEIGGTRYFRLRLGPFAVREEAEKFLGWVVEIDGFADSMIFVDYTTAVLAARSR